MRIMSQHYGFTLILPALLIFGFGLRLPAKSAVTVPVSSAHEKNQTKIENQHFLIVVGLNRVLVREGDILASNAMVHVATPLFPGNAVLFWSSRIGLAGKKAFGRPKLVNWSGIMSKQWLIEGNAIQCGNRLLSTELGYAFYRNVNSRIPGQFIFFKLILIPARKHPSHPFANRSHYAYFSVPDFTTEPREELL